MKEKFQDSNNQSDSTNNRNYREEQKALREAAIEDVKIRETQAKQKENERAEDLVEFLRVSVNDGFDGNDTDGYYIPLHERKYEGFADKYTTYFNKYMTLCFKYGLMFIFVSFNFIALSISLNCNVDKPIGTRIASALFAFFFGIVYIIVNYYTYRVLHQGKICKMNKERLFPFEI